MRVEKSTRKKFAPFIIVQATKCSRRLLITFFKVLSIIRESCKFHLDRTLCRLGPGIATPSSIRMLVFPCLLREGHNHDREEQGSWERVVQLFPRLKWFHSPPCFVTMGDKRARVCHLVTITVGLWGDWFTILHLLLLLPLPDKKAFSTMFELSHLVLCSSSSSHIETRDNQRSSCDFMLQFGLR